MSFFEKKEKNRPKKDKSKIKGVYAMSCSPGTADKDRHKRLTRRAMQTLGESSAHFKRLHAQATLDKPKLYESIQQMAAVPIGYSDHEIVNALVPRFKKWMQQQYGLTIEEEKWKDNFFSEVFELDTIHCVLIYFHT